jgi:glutathione S-transferase
MKLIYHPLSPYSRKVYILALELKLDASINLNKVVVAPVHYPGWSDNNLYVSDAGNPLAKIPTLVIDDLGGDPVGLFDSKFICDFLLDRAGKDAEGKDERGMRQKWLDKAIHAACDGITDAEILIVYEERLRDEKELRYQAWVDGQREKVMRGLDYLEKRVQDGSLRQRGDEESVSLAEVATGVTLGFFELRGIKWREGREALAKWYKKIERRPSFVQAPLARDAEWKITAKLT